MTPAHYTPAEVTGFCIVAVVLILINAFFAAAETSLLRVRDSRISQLVDEGSKRACIVERLRNHPERTLVAIQIMITLITTVASALTTALMHNLLAPLIGEALAITTASILVVFFLSLFGEITSKNWAVGHAEEFVLRSAPIVSFTSGVLLRPVAWLLEALSRLIIRGLGGHTGSESPYPTEEEIKLIVEEGARFGELEEDEKEMIHNVLEIPGITAREIMTPRTQMVAVEIGTSLEEVISIIVEEGHTRLPVYRGTIDNIIGILHAKDLLRVAHSIGDGFHIETLMKQPLHIPESKKVDKLLNEFKQAKAQMAVVIDEYGGTAGLVTMEDVLEEIVGPISDEYDEPEEGDIQMVEHGCYLVAGGAGIEDVCELLDMNVMEEDSEGNDTIGGLLFTLLGRVPKVGDTVEYAGWEMVVKGVEGRRIDLIQMARMAPKDRQDSDADEDSPLNHSDKPLEQ